MEKKFSKGIFTYMPSLDGERRIIQSYSRPAWALIFALEKPCLVNNIKINADCWILQKTEIDTKNTIEGEQSGGLLLISLQDVDYLEWKMDPIPDRGYLSITMLRAILDLLGTSPENQSYPGNSPEIYINILIQLLYASPASKKSPFRFQEVLKIHQTIQVLNTTRDLIYATANDLIKQSGLPTHRFQRGCLEMFGQSIQSLIHHKKMNQAFELIVHKHENPVNTAKSLGYKHYGNFITSFRSYFGLTPSLAGAYAGFSTFF
jgi:AraC-like DNA-binding protein